MGHDMSALEAVLACYGVLCGLVMLAYLYIGMQRESRPAEEIEAEDAAREAQREAERGYPIGFCLDVYEDHVEVVDEEAEAALARQGVRKCC